MLQIKVVEDFSYKKDHIYKGFIIPYRGRSVLSVCGGGKDKTSTHEDIAEELIVSEQLGEIDPAFLDKLRQGFQEQLVKNNGIASFKDFLIFELGSIALVKNGNSQEILYLDEDLNRSIEKVIFEYRMNRWGQKKFTRTKDGLVME